MSSDRFDDLFASLEAQAAAEATLDLEADVDEVARATVAEIRWADRLRGSDTVEIEVTGLGHLAGRVVAVGRDVVELAAIDGEWLVPLDAVESAVGLDGVAEPPSAISGRLGLGASLRAWTRDRAVVRLHRRGGAPLEGTIDRVGADFVDLAEHHADEPRREESVRRHVTVPMSAITAVRRLR